MADLWNDDRIQFARLIYEMELTQNLDYEALKQEMDLDAKNWMSYLKERESA